MQLLRVTTHGDFPPDVIAEIERTICNQQNLQDMMAWALAQPRGTFEPQVVSEVIVQDEFTHDVVVPRYDGLVLVYDTT